MITINILRISSDSKYLEFNVECGSDELFTNLYITRYDPVLKEDDPTLDFSSVLSGNSNSEIIRIATNLIDSDVTMYKVDFVASSDTEETTKSGICSNVNFVYAGILDYIVNAGNCCLSNTDYEIIDRNTLILYAHKEAMRLDRYPEAAYFYDII